MRALEVYNSSRLLNDKEKPEMEVHLIMYEDSTEYYSYMSNVDAEKIGFKKLIEIKEVNHK
jgi:hypothetical protein